MSFKSIASEQTGSSSRKSWPELDGREKVTAEELMKLHPQGVTITGFGWWKQGELIPVIFAEEPAYMWAGKALKDIITEWMRGWDSDYECSQALAAEGGVKVKFRRGKTKQGREMVYVDVID